MDFSFTPEEEAFRQEVRAFQPHPRPLSLRNGEGGSLDGGANLPKLGVRNR